MKGFEVIKTLKQFIQDDDIIISSNGNISREAYHLLPQPQIYLRGSMGLPVPVGLGIALAKPNNRILVITGDGNFLMGLGAATTAAFYHPKNLKILILDNNKYFTTGGQETVSPIINYTTFLSSLNIEYHSSKKADKKKIKEDLAQFLESNSFAVLHLEIEEGKENLTNIPWHPKQITEEFLKKQKLI
ncbi:MAG: thiamine pyrophosphate-dependent enzyme [Candidatus Thorarchaeota archaeon]